MIPGSVAAEHSSPMLRKHVCVEYLSNIVMSEFTLEDHGAFMHPHEC